MPLSEIDRAEVKREARGLLRSASVSPFKLMALFLLICLALDEISTAAGFLLRGALPFDPAAPADALPVIPRLSGFSLSMLFISILAGLLGMVLRAGFVRYCLGVHRGRAMPYESLFDAFPFAGKVVLLAFLEGLLAALGFMAFIFPGIYVLLIYSLAIFRLVETPEISVFEAMRRSRLDLRGRLTEYFALLLSFFPLLLLLAVPVGLLDFYVLRSAFPDTLAGNLLNTLVYGVLAGCASLYVEPYLMLAKVGFYRRVTEPPAQTGGAEQSEGSAEASAEKNAEPFEKPSDNEENRLD